MDFVVFLSSSGRVAPNGFCSVPVSSGRLAPNGFCSVPVIFR